MTYEDVADLDAVEQRVVDGKDGAAGDAEHGVDASLLQRTHKALRSGHRLVHRTSSPVVRLSSLLFTRTAAWHKKTPRPEG
jgi:hypothetical protein